MKSVDTGNFEYTAAPSKTTNVKNQLSDALLSSMFKGESDPADKDNATMLSNYLLWLGDVKDIVEHLDPLLVHSWKRYQFTLKSLLEDATANTLDVLQIEALKLLREHYPQVRESQIYLPINTKGYIGSILQCSCDFLSLRYQKQFDAQNHLLEVQALLTKLTLKHQGLLNDVRNQAQSCLRLTHLPDSLNSTLNTFSSGVGLTGRTHGLTELTISGPESTQGSFLKPLAKIQSVDVNVSYGAPSVSQSVQDDFSPTRLTQSGGSQHSPALKPNTHKNHLQFEVEEIFDSSQIFASKPNIILVLKRKADRTEVFRHDCKSGKVVSILTKSYFIFNSAAEPKKLYTYKLNNPMPNVKHIDHLMMDLGPQDFLKSLEMDKDSLIEITTMFDRKKQLTEVEIDFNWKTPGALIKLDQRR